MKNWISQMDKEHQKLENDYQLEIVEMHNESKTENQSPSFNQRNTSAVISKQQQLKDAYNTTESNIVTDEFLIKRGATKTDQMDTPQIM